MAKMVAIYCIVLQTRIILIFNQLADFQMLPKKLTFTIICQARPLQSPMLVAVSKLFAIFHIVHHTY